MGESTSAPKRVDAGRQPKQGFRLGQWWFGERKQGRGAGRWAVGGRWAVDVGVDRNRCEKVSSFFIGWFPGRQAPGQHDGPAGVEGTPPTWGWPRTRCACLYVWARGAEGWPVMQSPLFLPGDSYEPPCEGVKSESVTQPLAPTPSATFQAMSAKERGKKLKGQLTAKILLLNDEVRRRPTTRTRNYTTRHPSSSPVGLNFFSPGGGPLIRFPDPDVKKPPRSWRNANRPYVDGCHCMVRGAELASI